MGQSPSKIHTNTLPSITAFYQFSHDSPTLPGSPKHVELNCQQTHVPQLFQNYPILDCYQFLIETSQEKYQRQKSIYEQRKNNFGCFVKIIHYQGERSQCQCVTLNVRVVVYTEHIPFRLAHFKLNSNKPQRETAIFQTLTVDQAIYLLVNCLHAYQILSQQYTINYPSEYSIGISSKGSIKVWYNDNFSINQEYYRKIPEHSLVQEIIGLIEQRTTGTMEEIIKEKNRYEFITFNNMQDILSKWIINFHNGRRSIEQKISQNIHKKAFLKQQNAQRQRKLLNLVKNHTVVKPQILQVSPINNKIQQKPKHNIYNQAHRIIVINKPTPKPFISIKNHHNNPQIKRDLYPKRQIVNQNIGFNYSLPIQCKNTQSTHFSRQSFKQISVKCNYQTRLHSSNRIVPIPKNQQQFLKDKPLSLQSSNHHLQQQPSFIIKNKSVHIYPHTNITFSTPIAALEDINPSNFIKSQSQSPIYRQSFIPSNKSQLISITEQFKHLLKSQKLILEQEQQLKFNEQSFIHPFIEQQNMKSFETNHKQFHRQKIDTIKQEDDDEQIFTSYQQIN